MTTTLRSLVRGLGFAVALPLGACAPAITLTDAQIPTATKLGDIMWAQAALADPSFKKAGSSAFSDADWAAFSALATRLKLTSDKLKTSFSKGPAWDAHTVALAHHAEELGTAVAAKEVGPTNTALGAIKDTCRGCHKEFK